MARPDSIKGKALALLTANGGNVKKTAAALGIPRQSLDRWARWQNVGPEARRTKKEAEEQLAQKFEQVALDCLDAVTPDKYTSQGRKRVILGEAMQSLSATYSVSNAVLNIRRSG